jgi:hypothetical protein
VRASALWAVARVVGAIVLGRRYRALVIGVVLAALTPRTVVSRTVATSASAPGRRDWTGRLRPPGSFRLRPLPGTDSSSGARAATLPTLRAAAGLIALVRGSWLDPRRLLLVLLPLLGFASYLCVDAQLPKLRRRPTQHELHAHDATHLGAGVWGSRLTRSAPASGGRTAAPTRALRTRQPHGHRLFLSTGHPSPPGHRLRRDAVPARRHEPRQSTRTHHLPQRSIAGVPRATLRDSDEHAHDRRDETRVP